MQARLMRRAFAAGAVALLAAVPSAFGSAREADASGQSRITIFARPTVVAWAEPATLYGAAPGASHDDVVTIEVKECGSNFFRAFAELHPSSGGGWTTPAGSAITAAYRATWRNETSPAVTVRQAADVGLERRRSGGGFNVAASGKRSFWRKAVEIQRRRGGSWRTVKTVRLTDSASSTGVVSVSAATFRLAVPRGTFLRALLPAAQAAPCYVASTSRPIRA
jgi:hypothetical protein